MSIALSALNATSGTLAVTAGGTGKQTLTTHGVMIGAGTSALTILAAAAAGTLLQGAGASADPAFTATPVLGVAGTTAGTLGLSGVTSGVVSILTQAAAGTYNLNLPTGAGNSGDVLTSGGGGSTPMSWVTPIAINNLTDTWNNIATTFTAIKMNVTDTNSASASLLLDLQIGSATKFNVRKDGTATAIVGVNTPTVTLGTVSSATGALKLANASSANLTTIQAGNAANARTYTWPTDFGAAGTVLTDAAGNGTLSWAAGGGGLTINSTAISGGATNAILYGDGSVLQNAAGITRDATGAMSLAAGTITTNVKSINITQTWNASGTTFDAPLFVNVTNTQSASGSVMADIQVGGVTKFSVSPTKISLVSSSGQTIDFSNGVILYPNYGLTQMLFEIGGVKSAAARTNNFTLASGTLLSWNSNTMDNVGEDLFLRRAAAATLQFGSSNASSPVAQTLQAQGSRSGTDSNVGGATLTIQSGLGTGTGTPSSIILKAPVGATTGSGAQTQTLAMTIIGAANGQVPSVVVGGSAATATNATDGFLYIPTCAGTPTGTPTTQGTGTIPMVYDTTNDVFWFYRSGWKQPKTPAGAALVTWQ